MSFHGSFMATYIQDYNIIYIDFNVIFVHHGIYFIKAGSKPFNLGKMNKAIRLHSLCN